MYALLGGEARIQISIRTSKPPHGSLVLLLQINDIPLHDILREAPSWTVHFAPMKKSCPNAGVEQRRSRMFKSILHNSLALRVALEPVVGRLGHSQIAKGVLARVSVYL